MSTPKARTVQLDLIIPDPFANGETNITIYEWGPTTRQFDRGEVLTFPNGRKAVVHGVGQTERRGVEVVFVRPLDKA
jgi:hypothetical protein